MTARISKGFQPLQMFQQAVSQSPLRPPSRVSRADLSLHRGRSSGSHQNLSSHWQLQQNQRGFGTWTRLTLEKKPNQSSSKRETPTSSPKPQQSSNPSL